MTAGFADRDWPHWTEPSFVVVDGIRTAYRRSGEGETVLYLHGTRGTRAWLPLHEALAQSVDLVAPEHPGYGDTPRDPDHDSFEDYVLHYEGLIRALGLGRVHLVGASIGAWIAADLAIHHPERFASVTLITPFGARIADEPFIDVFRFTPEQAEAALFNGRTAARAQLVQEGGIDDVLHGFEEDSTSALLFFDRRYDHRLDRRLSRVRTPALVVGAEDDRVVGPDQAPRFAELIPGADLHVLAGLEGRPSSHGLVFEQPADVAALVVAHVVRSTPA